MRVNLFLLFLSILSLQSCNIDTSDKDITNYDPKKAGATIVKRFDISESFGTTFQYTDPELSDRYYIPKKCEYNLSEYDSDIYIYVNGGLYIFDKETMKKKKEIRIFAPDDTELFYRNNNNGFVVFCNFALIHLPVPYNDEMSGQTYYDSYLLLADLKNITFDERLGYNIAHATVLDVEKTLGTKIKSKNIPIMGYDKKKDLLWFWLDHYLEDYTTAAYYYFFCYNKDTKTFELKDAKTAPQAVIFNDQYDYSRFAVSYAISDTENWGFYRYNYSSKIPNHPGIDKRDINDPDTVLHTINIEHLGVDRRYFRFIWPVRRPENIIYDPPYIWIMVERGERIVMLKLLPNGDK